MHKWCRPLQLQGILSAYCLFKKTKQRSTQRWLLKCTNHLKLAWNGVKSDNKWTKYWGRLPGPGSETPMVRSLRRELPSTVVFCVFFVSIVINVTHNTNIYNWLTLTDRDICFFFDREVKWPKACCNLLTINWFVCSDLFLTLWSGLEIWILNF